MAAKTKDQLLMTDAEILGISSAPVSSESVDSTPPITVQEPKIEEPSTEGLTPSVEVKPENEDSKSALPKPADASQKVVSPLELIKLRKTGNPLCSVSEIIHSRKVGGKSQQTVQELIASRKSGQASGVTAMDIIAERKYSPKRQVKVLS